MQYDPRAENMRAETVRADMARQQGILGGGNYYPQKEQSATITEALTEQASTLKVRLVMLAAMVDEKFMRFRLDEPNKLGSGVPAPEKATRSYPPAFDALRNELDCIDENIYRLQTLIEKVQL